MAAQRAIPVLQNAVSYNDEFLSEFQGITCPDINAGDRFEIDSACSISIAKTKSEKPLIHPREKKLNPILRIAQPDDAPIITGLIKEVYDGTYPYKEMEDEREVRRMIESRESIFVLFLNNREEVIGSTTFTMDFKAKRGGMRTWVVKKDYHGKFESTNSLIGCCVYVWSLLKDKILVWYGEVRTAHGKTQYILDLISLKAVGFYPNKDIFYNKIESDVLQVSYNKKALKQHRCRKFPVIIPEALNLFFYSDSLYQLGDVKVSRPNMELDPIELTRLQKELCREITTDKFGYQTINLFFKGSDSYLKFLYTSTVHNFEKTEYHVNSAEELFVLAREFTRYAREYNVRYFEVFVSAYHPHHQQIFYDMGLVPRGYVPSWDYNSKKDCFEDRILFNHYEGHVDESMVLFDRTRHFMKYLYFETNE
jgi:hypothetical protein